MRPNLRRVVLLLGLFLAGCAPYLRAEQPQRGEEVLISREAAIGQTFVARYDGLEGVEIFLEPESPAGGEILYHLRAEPGSDLDLARGRLPLNQLSSPGYIRFPFAPQKDSSQAYYYFFIDLENPEGLQARADSGGAYLNGAAYLNHEPLDAQLSFRLVYDPLLMGWGLFKEGLAWIGILLAAGFLFVLPGWAILGFAYPGWGKRDWAEKLALSAGASLAVYPAVMVWLDLLGLHIGPWLAWLLPSFSLAVLLWAHRSQLRHFKLAAARSSLWNTQTAVYFTLFGLLVFTRFWVLRNLQAPMWGDSQQHTMITHLLVENGGLFDSWLPYAELQSFTYHFGFHAGAALLHWVTRLPVAGSVMWAGQIFNLLAVWALIPLANKIGGGKWAGSGAVLLSGLIVNMPSFYINWGRYTQLTGQVILPVSLFLMWELLQRGQGAPRFRILAGFVLGGLALTHYRVVIFAALFLPVYWAFQVRRNSFRRNTSDAVWIGFVAGVIFAPWFVNVFGGKIFDFLAGTLQISANAVPASLQRYNAVGDLSQFLPPFVWGLMIVCLGWGIWRQKAGAALLAGWWAILILAANPAWLGLPGSGALTNFAVFIAAYIPAGILVGAGINWSLNRFPASRTFSALLIGLFLLAGVWGARQRILDVKIAGHSLVTRPDVIAAEWIQENTPVEARFLVNSFPAYGNTSTVGSDAGWWLPLIAQRQTTLPPITYTAEAGPRPDYIPWVNELTAMILSQGVSSPQVLAMLSTRGVTHVYIGQQQGRVNYKGPVLEPETLLADPNFAAVYHRDRVWIFSFSPLTASVSE